MNSFMYINCMAFNLMICLTHIPAVNELHLASFYICQSHQIYRNTSAIVGELLLIILSVSQIQAAICLNWMSWMMTMANFTLFKNICGHTSIFFGNWFNWIVVEYMIDKSITIAHRHIFDSIKFGCECDSEYVWKLTTYWFIFDLLLR